MNTNDIKKGTILHEIEEIDGSVNYDIYTVVDILGEGDRYRIHARRERDGYERVIAGYSEKFKRLFLTKDDALNFFVSEQIAIIDKAISLIAKLK